MTDKDPFLCGDCPGKGNHKVDPDVVGSSPTRTIDSFRQTRGYRLTHPEEYRDNDEMAELSADNLRYFDDGSYEVWETTGDIDAAHIGIACAENLLAGKCRKTREQILRDSEIF